MSNVIGVCVTRIQGEMCRTFLGSLLKSAKKAGYRVCVFQSVYDFDEEGESGAAFVFDAIPYENLCALIILHDTIYDKELKARIIHNAIKAGLPVIIARDEYPGCYGLVGTYEKEYEKLVSEVLKKNSIDDVFYIGGRRNSGVDSRRRIEIFRKVCKELNIAFDDSKIGYGEYYEVPTYKIVDGLLEGGRKPPRAIFCANDIMALAVIERLKQRGYDVPGDTVVVGFDGLESARFSSPALTTCAESMDIVSGLAVEVIEKALRREIAPKTFNYDFFPVYAASAGFDGNGIGENSSAGEIFKRFRLDDSDEEACNAWIDNLLSQQDFDHLNASIPRILVKGREVLVRPEAYWKFSRGEEAEKLPERVISYAYDDEGIMAIKECNLKSSMIECLVSCKEDEMVVFSAISVHNIVYGIAVDRTSDPLNEGGRLNRFVITLNRGLSIAVSGERQLYLAEKINRSRYTDPLTEMLNYDGASRWYKNYVSDEIAKQSYMLIGVYSLISYARILNEYGADFLETCLKYVASTLKEMNPDNTMIARISSDSFVVGYIFENEHNSSREIEVTINNFFTAVETKRTEGPDWDILEVSCGYVSDELEDNDSFEGYINAALATLYRNRAAVQRKTAQIEKIGAGKALLDYRRRLISLIQDDRFIYHFQPIVSAISGEIVAYEALMRTDETVGMTPLEALNAMEMFDKYADMERCTFTHILRRIRSQINDFDGKKIFINTIPGHFLTKVEVRNLREEFGDLLKRVTIELTESQTADKKEIEAIRHFAGEDCLNDIAVDDYGTGHSNIVNLLEYRPQIVKVDRYLISNIQNDRNKQMFVKTLIEFAKDANIQVLAEGVETSEELKCVIELGVGLIQGYYTARPAFEVIERIPAEISEEIKRINQEKSSK
ncbi:MAG: EAL domain-containing protein [Lachnospiraceae bacterium]|nr:EAL domain-containing protein [Lachnospiraceae bacterium]